MLNSLQSLKTIFEHALLANAAYGDYQGIAFEATEGEYTSRLQSVFNDSVAAAEYFADRFGVVHHQPDTASGLSPAHTRCKAPRLGSWRPGKST